jgi:hypothetical protein
VLGLKPPDSQAGPRQSRDSSYLSDGVTSWPTLRDRVGAGQEPDANDRQVRTFGADRDFAGALTPTYTSSRTQPTCEGVHVKVYTDKRRDPAEWRLSHFSMIRRCGIIISGTVLCLKRIVRKGGLLSGHHAHASAATPVAASAATATAASAATAAAARAAAWPDPSSQVVPNSYAHPCHSCAGHRSRGWWRLGSTRRTRRRRGGTWRAGRFQQPDGRFARCKIWPNAGTQRPGLRCGISHGTR